MGHEFGNKCDILAFSLFLPDAKVKILIIKKIFKKMGAD
jgi:hypothetical protein